MDLKEMFKKENGVGTFKRINAIHPLDIYIGHNSKGNKTLVIVEFGQIEEVESTRMIDVIFTKRTDNKLSLSFSLLDDSMQDMFYSFCEDIIESSKNTEKEKAIQFVIRRWKDWINLFKNPYTTILTENEIRGLIGELIFLNEFIFEKYGLDKGLKSWIGSSKAHKDFEIEDTWYEIKTIRENSLIVKIHSIEQLDAKNIGNLILIRLEPSNTSINEYIDLNRYVEKIKNKLIDDQQQMLFLEKLKEVGYFYTEEYDKYIYSLKKIERYTVNDKFPKITKKELRDEIVRVSYDIEIDSIKSFKIEG